MFNGNLIFSDAQEYNLCPLKYRSSLMCLAPSFNLLRKLKRGRHAKRRSGIYLTGSFTTSFIGGKRIPRESLVH